MVPILTSSWRRELPADPSRQRVPRYPCDRRPALPAHPGALPVHSDSSAYPRACAWH